MFQLVLSIISLFILFGCGADSDLLKDTSISSKPKGLAADVMQKGMYQYTRIDDKRIGLIFIGVNSDCSESDCIMIEDHYVLFDNNITKIENNKNKRIIFTPYGWQEQSEHDECLLKFKGSKMTEECLSGQKNFFSFDQENLKESKLLEIYPKVIDVSIVKDEYADFTDNAFYTSVTQTYLETPYTIDLYESSKCFTDYNMTMIANTKAFEEYETLYFSLKDHIFVLKNVVQETGKVEVYKQGQLVYDLPEIRWKKKKLDNKYQIIELEIADEVKKILSLENDVFITYYNEEMRYGSKAGEIKKSIYLNKVAFDNIYTQIKEKYKGKSKVIELLREGMYEIGRYADKEGYIKYILNKNNENIIEVHYDAFFETSPSPNWILNKHGLNRESAECDIIMLYDSYHISCDDGRENIYQFTSQQNLKEEFIDSFLKKNKLPIKIENTTALFSVRAKEMRFQKESINTSYIFNLDNSLDVGTSIGANDASALFETTLYIASKDKKSYIEIKSPSLNSSGIAKCYIKTVLQDGNITWKSKNIGGINIIRIEVPNNLKKYFNNKNNLVLVEKTFDRKKIITGTILDDIQKKHTMLFFNYEGYKDIESLTNTKKVEE